MGLFSNKNADDVKYGKSKKVAHKVHVLLYRAMITGRPFVLRDKKEKRCL